MIRAIIIDDEPAARASLDLEIRLHCPEIVVVAEADSVQEGIRVIQATAHFDLLFLDIQMADGTGFDVLQNVEAERFKTIFTTAYSEYALRAIKFTPLDFSYTRLKGRSVSFYFLQRGRSTSYFIFS